MKYRTEEICIQNHEKHIYGVAYIPEGKGQFPLLILSHELGNNHESVARYAERLAENGYAAYIFDFCGGSVPEVKNRSDGYNHELSVLTEAADLEAVLEMSKGWSFADGGKTVLIGCSMGALATTVVGCRRQEEIAGIVLLYPALSALDDYERDHSGAAEETSTDISLFGGWMYVGKSHVAALQEIDFYHLLSSYQGRILLLHGNRDGTVPLSYSEKAAEVIPDCEFHVIRRGRHGFTQKPFEDAMAYILTYMERLLET